ncbi:MAG TPA: sugar transferase, partial [Fibrella sp.]
MTSFTVQNLETVSLEPDQNLTIQNPTWGLYAKRIADLLVAGIVTISILIWLIPLITVLIRLTSKGPALFVQIRSGRGGEQFP